MLRLVLTFYSSALSKRGTKGEINVQQQNNFSMIKLLSVDVSLVSPPQK